MEALVSIVIVAVIVIWVRKRKRSAKETLELTLAVVGFEASGRVYSSGHVNGSESPTPVGSSSMRPREREQAVALYNTTADTDKLQVLPKRAKWSNGPSR